MNRLPAINQWQITDAHEPHGIVVFGPPHRRTHRKPAQGKVQANYCDVGHGAAVRMPHNSVVEAAVDLLKRRFEIRDRKEQL